MIIYGLSDDVLLWVRGIDTTWSEDTVSHTDVMKEVLDTVDAPIDPFSISQMLISMRSQDLLKNASMPLDIDGCGLISDILDKFLLNNI